MCKLKQYMHILIPQLTWLGTTKNKITDHYEPNQTTFFYQSAYSLQNKM